MTGCKGVMAPLVATAFFWLAGCDLSDSECDRCDGEMHKDNLCVVTLEDLPGGQDEDRDAQADTSTEGTPDASTGDPDLQADVRPEQWQSAPWYDVEWLSLPGGTKVKVQHALGRVPDVVQVYLSFEKDDSDREGSRSAFLAAGDLAHITDVTKKSVTIKNKTEQDFCLRLVLE